MTNPREVSETEIVLQAQDAARSARSADEARARIGASFSPQPTVLVVREKNRRAFDLLIQPFPGAKDIHAVCARSAHN